MEQFTLTMALCSQHSRLRTGSCKLLAATVLLVVAAGRGEQNDILVATWELKSVAAHSPSALNIRSWRVAFERGGRWTYSGEMMGRFEGMKLSGHGSWNTKGSQLSYTAGDNHGQSEFSVKNEVLTLSPIQSSCRMEKRQ
jgi:hypothetical protein